MVASLPYLKFLSRNIWYRGYASKPAKNPTKKKADPTRSICIAVFENTHQDRIGQETSTTVQRIRADRRRVMPIKETPMRSSIVFCAACSANKIRWNYRIRRCPSATKNGIAAFDDDTEIF